MVERRTIAVSEFDDKARRFTLGGMAADMFTWLEDLAAGSGRYRGYELVGTLDPRDPDPEKFKEPPNWLTPQVLMDAMCAWQAGATQDYLFRNGMAPLVRARVGSDGSLVSVSGADVGVASGRVGGTSERRYWLVVNQEGSPYPLGDLSTISAVPIQPTSGFIESASPRSFVAARLDSSKVTNEELSDLVDPADIPFSSFFGWAYSFGGGAAMAADVHIFV